MHGPRSTRLNGFAAIAPPEAVARIEATETRLHRACLTLDAFPPVRPRAYYSTWPAYRLTWWDAGAEISRLADRDIARRFLRAPRFSPTPADIDDLLDALALLDGAPRLAFLVLHTRARATWYGWRGGWRAIGHLCDCSHETARRVHYDAVLRAAFR